MAMSTDNVSTELVGPEQAASPVFLTTEEAAALLRWLPDTVRRKACAGELPGVRQGRQWRFEREQLHAYVRGTWQPANARARLSLRPGPEMAAQLFRQVKTRKEKEAEKRGSRS
jgi:excisionase family DNA binding protein